MPWKGGPEVTRCEERRAIVFLWLTRQGRGILQRVALPWKGGPVVTRLTERRASYFLRLTRLGIGYPSVGLDLGGVRSWVSTRTRIESWLVDPMLGGEACCRAAYLVHMSSTNLELWVGTLLMRSALKEFSI